MVPFSVVGFAGQLGLATVNVTFAPETVPLTLIVGVEPHPPVELLHVSVPETLLPLWVSDAVPINMLPFTVDVAEILKMPVRSLEPPGSVDPLHPEIQAAIASNAKTHTAFLIDFSLFLV